MIFCPGTTSLGIRFPAVFCPDDLEASKLSSGPMNRKKGLKINDYFGINGK